MKLTRIFILLVLGNILISSCTSKEKYKKDLLSDDEDKINKACYELGEDKDASAIKLLLTKALDPRISHDIRFKGMSVNYCRLGALKKITEAEIGRKIDQSGIDTAATMFYLNWAVRQGYLKDKNEVDIYYHK